VTAPCDHRGGLRVEGERIVCTRCEPGAQGLAWVDVARALPPAVTWSIFDQIEAELGPEAIGSLETAWDWWGRPVQLDVIARAETLSGIVLITGDYGSGKTRVAKELLEHLILTGRAEGPRILAATGAGARSLVLHKKTGWLRWQKPGVTYQWEPSKGFEGQFVVNGVVVDLMSIEAPLNALGEGTDVQLLDDPPKWGATGRDALIACLKSARERGTLTIIPTTKDGLALVASVLGVEIDHLEDGAGVTVIDLGSGEANAGNLDASYFLQKDNMRRAGTWDPVASVSPWRTLTAGEKPGESGGLTAAQWARVLTEERDVRLVELAVSIDPNKGGSSKPCEVGIVGGGRSASDVLHVTHDRSAVLDGGAEGWPKVAWDLAEELHRLHPGAPFPVFVFEPNVGRAVADGLYQEEVNRRLRRGEPGVPYRTRIVFVRADKDKCVRAENPARAGAHGQVRIAPGLHVLVGQLRNLTPKGVDSDRADAANHLLTHLGRLAEGEKAVEREVKRAATLASFTGLSEAQKAIPAPAWALPADDEREPEWDRV
jgi:phage terminase large subunit-like protein